MNNGNTHNLEISAEKLYKLAVESNRDSAKSQGFYDGRFGTKVEPNKKRTEYLGMRRDKPSI